MKKVNKIRVCVAADSEKRAAMVAQLVVNMGFAKIPSEARKIVCKHPQDFDLRNSYFVFASDYSLNESLLTTQRLYELAVQGVAVVIGSAKIPPQMEFMCEAWHPEEFARL